MHGGLTPNGDKAYDVIAVGHELM